MDGDLYLSFRSQCWDQLVNTWIESSAHRPYHSRLQKKVKRENVQNTCIYPHWFLCFGSPPDVPGAVVDGFDGLA